ncbi:hypothetical protein PAPYR_12053 [Paratrimastix pyriformis]|uniref:Uncharacterized protein n=1 Tax=Paratrimastix pyriformis TaxID=342808 RepID=A0ABQ8U2H7_9EUKA|nr:hypothetical protein PAPYR_12053 [Paratrimastix pyriformis]
MRRSRRKTTRVPATAPVIGDVDYPYPIASVVSPAVNSPSAPIAHPTLPAINDKAGADLHRRPDCPPARANQAPVVSTPDETVPPASAAQAESREGKRQSTRHVPPWAPGEELPRPGDEDYNKMEAVHDGYDCLLCC